MPLPRSAAICHANLKATSPLKRMRRFQAMTGIGQNGSMLSKAAGDR
jgi:hypothetical protein